MAGIAMGVMNYNHDQHRLKLKNDKVHSLLMILAVI
jgi:hypothetical protein